MAGRTLLLAMAREARVTIEDGEVKACFVQLDGELRYDEDLQTDVSAPIYRGRRWFRNTDAFTFITRGIAFGMVNTLYPRTGTKIKPTFTYNEMKCRSVGVFTTDDLCFKKAFIISCMAYLISSGNHIFEDGDIRGLTDDPEIHCIIDECHLRQVAFLGQRNKPPQRVVTNRYAPNPGRRVVQPPMTTPATTKKWNIPESCHDVEDTCTSLETPLQTQAASPSACSPPRDEEQKEQMDAWSESSISRDDEQNEQLDSWSDCLTPRSDTSTPPAECDIPTTRLFTKNPVDAFNETLAQMSLAQHQQLIQNSRGSWADWLDDESD